MKIRMLDSESTRIHGGKAFHYRKGQEYDLPDDIAEAWITIRLAEAVSVPKPRLSKTADRTIQPADPSTEEEGRPSSG